MNARRKLTYALATFDVVLIGYLIFTVVAMW